MITFQNENGQVALVVTCDAAAAVVATFESFEAFRNAEPEISRQSFNGPLNYVAIAAAFDGWTQVCRDDNTWEVVDCGPLPQPEVPANVSARQIRLWMVSTGITLAQIETLIDNIPDPQQREYTRVEWEYAPYIERNHPMVAVFGTALGLTEEQIDAGFIAAAGL